MCDAAIDCLSAQQKHLPRWTFALASQGLLGKHAVLSFGAPLAAFATKGFRKMALLSPNFVLKKMAAV